MRKPAQVERLYLDYDGFFAAVEQYHDKSLRGKPIGVVPFAGTHRTAVIACSREAKMCGVKNVMSIPEARQICPDIVFVPQKPDLYRRMHLTLLNVISSVLPIDSIKSIDELTCRLEPAMRDTPHMVARSLKAALQDNVGQTITCSIGIAANRHLAKMACKAGKKNDGRSYGNGLAIWKPEDLPGPLLKIPLEDIPGVGKRMKWRLLKANIVNTEMLLRLEPKHMRKLWRNVNGERLWYALHGYDIESAPSERGMFGHSRVLPPESRSLPKAYDIARLLVTKAARRLRREDYYAAGIYLSLSIRSGYWSHYLSLPVVRDDQAILAGLARLWHRAAESLAPQETIFKVSVTLCNLCKTNQRQLDMLLNDDAQRKRWEAINHAVDCLNTKYAATVISLGNWKPPAGGHAGGKISYTRIPSAEDFW